MKYLIMAILALLLITPCFAEETNGAVYSSPNGSIPQEFVDFINEQECIDHTHQYSQEDRDNPAGLGVDAILWQNEAKNVAVEVQEKYDIANKENSVYAVVKLNLFEMFVKKE